MGNESQKTDGDMDAAFRPLIRVEWLRLIVVLLLASVVEVAVCVGYAEKEMSPGGRSGWSDISAAANVAWTPTPRLTLGVSAAYTDHLDTDVLPDTDADSHAGVHVTWRY